MTLSGATTHSARIASSSVWRVRAARVTSPAGRCARSDTVRGWRDLEGGVHACDDPDCCDEFGIAERCTRG
eukprot:5514368-Prymnesium_polylepis.2